VTVSKTSQAVAVTRAGFARPNSPLGDPRAQRRLCAGMRSVILTDMRASLAARTMFFDEQVISAIASGVRQVVILGAGYDDRALRFRSPGVTFFELDHPNTASDKQARLAWILAEDRLAASDSVHPPPAAVPSAAGAPCCRKCDSNVPTLSASRGPVLARADFAADDVAGVLARAGFDPEVATLFVCEGLLVYLDRPANVRFLRSVAAAAAPGSVLAASLAIHADGLDSSLTLAMANARRRTADAEPWLTILSAAGQVDLLAMSGWLIKEAVDAANLGTGAHPGRSLLLTARPAEGSVGSAPPGQQGGSTWLP
jgi:O-methyltransferase involved in polyketide biosynthesis